MDDSHFMRKALAIAERGRGRTSPNPMVGALVVDGEGAIVGRGAHQVAGGPHAEVIALNAAGGRARGGTLLLKLEPGAPTRPTRPRPPPGVQAGERPAAMRKGGPEPPVRGRSPA